MDIIKELFPLSELDIEYKSNNKRKAYRIKCKDLFVFFRNKKYKVKDISATGIGILLEDDISVKEGMDITIDLFVQDKLFLKDLKAKVVRVDGNLIGCEFKDLSRRDELALDKLVLELQKKELERRKTKTL